ncbi:hypothetical protein CBQ28_08790 [Pseudoalteromonas sp. GCY]|uniref:FAD-binding oxidoreductase n=1 Tax=Pseudoalteromonas sp. GCY TaxID=2003316 RepID=UPI000BFEF3DB|nr:FAD-dependent oxidoreductase [Pseudoalteromonas sp. GCY]PHI37455.1 hypothetical protein CBQ28_08790 [Pseudoalteromonas sp. GCY]QQQ64833.1 FAD-dependent oxidoreductase [Pseudoalteromonas sp. GCY]
MNDFTNSTDLLETLFDELSDSVEAHFGNNIDQLSIADTIKRASSIQGVVYPLNVEVIKDIVKIANTHNLVLHPVSTGKNWGYGCAVPPTECDGRISIIVNLSKLNEIVYFDAELGLIELQPGVTQGQLYKFLQDRNADFLVPVTGAGPDCSILGNALEKGYGITPISDHFQSIISINAVLPNGEEYKSPMSEILEEKGYHAAYKWGIGPYSDGLFCQSNYGIVTSATITLARRTPEVMSFYFWLPESESLESIVNSVRNILSIPSLGVGGINIINSTRTITMNSTLASLRNNRNTNPLDPNEIEKYASVHNIKSWFGFGAIYGTKDSVKSAKKFIKKQLSPSTVRILFINKAKLSFLQSAVSYLPKVCSENVTTLLEKMGKGLSMMAGKPDEVALPLAYWRARNPPPDENLNPARDKCGLLWYAPIVSMSGKDCDRYVKMVTDICNVYGFDAPITLTSISPFAFDSTLPILFSASSTTESEQAIACYKALYEAGLRNGFVPYRIGSGQVQLFNERQLSAHKLTRNIKSSIDPNHIISPGRYV